MSEEEKETKTEDQEPTSSDSGEGDKSEGVEIIKQQSTRIKELEKERDQKVMDEAKKQMHGTAEGGEEPVKKVEVSDEQYYKDVTAGKYNIKK